MPISDAERFYRHVYPDPNTGCWLWGGPAHYSGRYGALGFRHGHILIDKADRAVSVLAHRLSWYLHQGKVPTSDVLHRCDQPFCVNPDHLFIGTHADNMADKTSKRRHRFGVRSGETNHNAKLTEAAVGEIRHLIADRMPRRQIAHQYGVSKSAINWIAKGRTWASGSKLEVRDAGG